MAGEFSDKMSRHVWYECPNWILAKSLQSMVFCYLLSSDVCITNNK